MMPTYQQAQYKCLKNPIEFLPIFAARRKVCLAVERLIIIAFNVSHIFVHCPEFFNVH